MCVCVCVWLGSSCSFKHVSLNNKDKFFLYNLFKILSIFSVKSLSFRLELVDEFPKIVPSAFGPFIGHYQGLLACERCVCFLKEFLNSSTNFYTVKRNHYNSIE